VSTDVIAIPSGGGTREQHPIGQHIGVCCDVIVLGDRVEAFEGKPEKIAPKIAFLFRTDKIDSEGRHFEISKELTLSDGDRANLPKFLGTWRGTPFAKGELKSGLKPAEWVGKPCILTLAAKGAKNYTNIEAITPLFPGLPVPALPPYTRAAFWEQRKAEYAAGVAAFHAKQQQAASVASAPNPALAQAQAQAALAKAVAAEEASQPTFDDGGTMHPSQSTPF